MRPAGDGPEDVEAARRADGQQNRWFLDPVLCGRYPEDLLAFYERRFGAFEAVQAGDLELIAEPVDFLGVNYYFPRRVAADATCPPLGLRTVAGAGPLTAMGWDIDPDGLHETLVGLRRDYGDVPIAITENGAAFDDGPATDGYVDDPERLAYLRSHVDALARAVADGVDVRRYYAWSLLDNFEWEHGYTKRFGIVHVDYATQRRIPKRSGLWYRDFIAALRGR
jgi:beta-glucosidase